MRAVRKFSVSLTRSATLLLLAAALTSVGSNLQLGSMLRVAAAPLQALQNRPEFVKAGLTRRDTLNLELKCS
jgi:hypothetical protein